MAQFGAFLLCSDQLALRSISAECSALTQRQCGSSTQFNHLCRQSHRYHLPVASRTGPSHCCYRRCASLGLSSSSADSQSRPSSHLGARLCPILGSQGSLPVWNPRCPGKDFNARQPVPWTPLRCLLHFAETARVLILPLLSPLVSGSLAKSCLAHHLIARRTRSFPRFQYFNQHLRRAPPHSPS